MGNRVTKYHRTISTNLEVLTYYVRDAQGNVMATYETNKDNDPAIDNYVLKELNIYGSSRIGVLNADVKIKNEPINLRGDPPVNSTIYATANKKQYELTNHLGNVLSTVSDAAPSPSKEAQLLSSNDYYPFGSPMPNRNFSSSEYRFGFNGQEKTDEISGEGNHLDFKFRGYDSRTGRFWSVDPLFKEYTWNSSYAFAENDVIRHVDLEGLEKGTRPATTTTTAIDNTRPSIFIGDLILKSKTPVPKQWVSTNPNPVFNFLENFEAKLPKGDIANSHKYEGTRGLKELGRDAAPVLDGVGTTATIVGYGSLLFGQPEIGLPLIEAGNVVSKFADGVEIANKTAEDGLKEGAKEFGKKAIFEVVSKSAQIPIKNSSLDKASKDILETNVDLKTKGAEKLYDKLTEDKK